MTRAQVARLHSVVGAEQRTTANRLVTLLSNFYSWAGDSGHVPKGCNPTTGVEKYPESGRERYLSQDEFARLGASIREAETTGIAWGEPGKPRSKHNPNRRTVIAPEAAAALRLLLFTGARLREILHLQWKNVDFDRGMLFLPDSKTGRKPVVLGAPALAVLAELRELRLAALNVESLEAGRALRSINSSEYVIYGRDPKKPRADLSRPWAMIRRHAGLEGVRLHDLRHSYASIGAGAGLGLPIIGSLLGHKSTATTARYAHLDSDPLRRATDAIAGSIAASLAGPKP